ncbi:MAG: LexA family transcriptional regulator [Weeksellaceae bacterium]
MDIPVENQRLKQLRQEFNLTQAEFAEVLGESQSTADMERGKTKLSGKVVMTLLKQYDINPLWLYDESDKKYLKAYDADPLPKTITVNEDGHENILLVSQKAAAGYAVNMHDSSYLQNLPAFGFPLPAYRNASFRGFEITGDSMVPLVQSGDWVLAKAVSSMSDIINNNIYVVVEPDNIRLKKVQLLDKERKARLISLNPEYDPTLIPLENILEMWEYHSRISFGIDKIQGLTLQKVYDEVKEIRRKIE